ncbi:MAG: ATP-binding protein [Bacteroidales bacterium]|nr:ATP-binding protein [Bacteroidales bacterium]
MGIYLNPNNVLLQRAKKSEIFIDKSMMIAELNKLVDTENNFLCISRPRRFGKSMAGNMISAYYSKGCDSRELFMDLKIAKDKSFEEYLNKLNVIKFDLNAVYRNIKDKSNLIDFITEMVKDELRETFPSVKLYEDDTLPIAIQRVYAKTGETFAVIIDEYDVLVREQVESKLFNAYLEFLNGLFKNTDLSPAISLAYLTGILPIVRDKIQSKLNLFTEYSMTNPMKLAEFVGFTAEETKGLCEQYGMDYEECKRWYDGYDLKTVREIFSPRSVVSAMMNREYGSYWTQTGSYEALKLYILMNFDGMKDDVITMMGGGKAPVEVDSYLNTMTDFHGKDDVFTYLIHLGYLAYDRETQLCYIPNEEIRKQWVISVQHEKDYQPIIKMINDSKQLLEATINKDEAAVAAALSEAHIRTTNPLTYNNEASFQSAIGLAYFYANTKYTVIKELPTGKGYADLALIPYVPNIPAMIIELKNNKSAESAINQIKEKKYDDLLEHYRGDLLFVGINYDPDTKEHQCRIEKCVIE